MDNIRDCVSCDHLIFEAGCEHYSEDTPGWDAKFKCLKGLWDMSNWGSIDDFRASIKKGERCSFYTKG